MMSQQSINSNRNSGIDLLRILSMYMVCVLHVNLAGGIFQGTDCNLFKNSIVWVIEIAAYCAVNCFALISGYVGVKSTFRYRNLFRLWLQVFFWSVVLALGCKFCFPHAVTFKDLAKSFLPVSTNEYWYFSAYFLMFFTIPLMNFLLTKADPNLLKTFFLTSFILFCVTNCLPGISGMGRPLAGGLSAIWLCLLYLVGGFVRLYGMVELFRPSSHENTRLAKLYENLISWLWATPSRAFVVYVIGVSLTVAIAVGGHLIMLRLCGHDPICRRFVSYLSPTIMLCSLALLEFFSTLKIRADFWGGGNSGG